MAKYKAKAEEELKKITGLNLIIVRPAVVYGPGDFFGISESGHQFEVEASDQEIVTD